MDNIWILNEILLFKSKIYKKIIDNNIREYYLLNNNDIKIITEETISKCTYENSCNLYLCENGNCIQPTDAISGHLLYLSNVFIKCNENKCEGTVGKENSYYVNSNKIEIQGSSSYENLLIHCDKDKKCTLSWGGENNV